MSAAVGKGVFNDFELFNSFTTILCEIPRKRSAAGKKCERNKILTPSPYKIGILVKNAKKCNKIINIKFKIGKERTNQRLKANGRREENKKQAKELIAKGKSVDEDKEK
ncbi:jg2192 [Pararge aegeria aegeria]|uniref:Jg2192 protein n=1 Tax=Pararge aegeria aegeria TaxID=348720 RepID=A0A8S4R0G9_9NEOP|nr:jg2192 [Pararge aegeria aegeria]